jgi:serine/threonine-protein phosphatase PGAM5
VNQRAYVRLILMLTLALGLGVRMENAAAATQTAPSFTRTLYLIRHGAYVPDPKADPVAGPSLTPLGVAQARLIGARLRGIPVHFNSLTSSTMTRARETAAVIHDSLPDVPLTQNALLSECGPQTWRDKAAAPTPENLQCQRNVDEAFKTYFTPATQADEHNVIVAHGNVIRYLVTKALGVDTRSWLGMSIAHTSLTIIRVRFDGSLSILAVGDIGHVPPNLQSWGTDDDPQLVTPPVGLTGTALKPAA